VSGSSGTVLATLLLFPLERLKTLLQVVPDDDSDDSPAALGLRGVLLCVLRKEGFGGLYRGCVPMLQTVGASNFLYFFLFEGLKEKLAKISGQPDGAVGPYEMLASSALAGALNMVVTEPLWRACVMAQAQPSLPGRGEEAVASSSSSSSRSPRGVFRTVFSMWMEEGPRALWRGLGSSLWLVSNPVIQFFVYDLLKELRLATAAEEQLLSTAEAFAMGAVAKALATVLTFPLQVAQSRLRAAQSGGRRPSIGGGKALAGDNRVRPELQGMVPCLRALFHEKGMSGLYFGLGPKLLQTVTQAAFMFAFYEKVLWVIRRLSRNGMRRLKRRMRSRSGS